MNSLSVSALGCLIKLEKNGQYDIDVRRKLSPSPEFPFITQS